MLSNKKSEHRVVLNSNCLIYFVDKEVNNDYLKNVAYNAFDFMAFDNIDYRYFKNFDEAWNSLYKFQNMHFKLSDNYSEKSHGYKQGFNNEKGALSYSLNLRDIKYVYFCPLGYIEDTQSFMVQFDYQDFEDKDYKIIGNFDQKSFIYNLHCKNENRRSWNDFELSISNSSFLDEPFQLNYSNFFQSHQIAYDTPNSNLCGSHKLPRIFNVATEPLMQDLNIDIEHLITPANGMQAFSVINKCKNLKRISFVDIQPQSILFTKMLLMHYEPELRGYYQFCELFKEQYSVSLIEKDKDRIKEYEQEFLSNIGYDTSHSETTFKKLKTRINNLQIDYHYNSLTNYNFLQELTDDNKTFLIYFSNIFHYVPTSFYSSQIDYNFFLKKIAYDEQSKKNKSYFYGQLPLSRKYGFGDYIVCTDEIDIELDDDFDYEWRKDYFESSQESFNNNIVETGFNFEINVPNQIVRFFNDRQKEQHYQNLQPVSKNDKFDWVVKKSKIATLKLNLKIPYTEMYNEANSLLSEFIIHRNKYEEGHRGWKSLVLHGSGKHYTLGADQYDDAPDYHWTDICDKCPITYDFIKNSLFIDSFERVRFMLLEPNGFICPHKDDDEHRLQTFNIALNHPEDCIMGMENYGIVPWKEGDVRMMNISVKHSVWNRSNKNRIHLIVHGGPSKKIYEQKFNKMVIDSYESLYDSIN